MTRGTKANFVLVFGGAWGWIYILIMGLFFAGAMVLAPWWANAEAQQEIPIGLFLFMCLPAMFAGGLLSWFYYEPLGVPALYCVPGYGKNLRRFVFLTGFVLALAFTLPFLRCTELSASEEMIAAVTGFSIFLTIYLTFVLPLRCVKGTTFVVVIMAAAFILCISDIERAEFYLRHALRNAGLWILLLVLYWGVVWFLLREKAIRRNQAEIIAAGAKLKQEQYPDCEITPRIEKFFLEQMARCEYLSTGRYLWGSLYCSLGPLLGWWRRRALFLAALVIGSNYVAPYLANSILFIWACPYGFSHPMLPFRSSMLTTGGRKERFWGIIAASAGESVFVLGTIVPFMVLLGQLARIVPEIELAGKTFSFYPVNPLLLYGLLWLVPIVYTIRVCFAVRRILTGLVVGSIFLFLFFGGLGPIFNIEWKLTTSKLVIAVIILAFCWSLFLLILRPICTKANLVGQRG